MLKNLVRDWGPEGAAERAQSYGRIVAELRECFRVRVHGIHTNAPGTGWIIGCMLWPAYLLTLEPDDLIERSGHELGRELQL